MTSFPPTIRPPIGATKPRGVFDNLDDPAKLLVGTSRYSRPMLRSGALKFEWPVGVEGIRFQGSPTLAEHKYIGDNDVVLDVTHLDDQRIEMNGVFPGFTGTQNMQDLMAVIRAPQPNPGKVLVLPRDVFSMELIVAVADYDFDHPSDDRNQTWNYTITFRRVSTGRQTSKAKTTKSPVNPYTSKAQPRGKSSRVFTVHAGANTLRAIAQLVYGNPNRWSDIYNKNKSTLKKYGPLHTIPTKRLALGLKLNY